MLRRLFGRLICWLKKQHHWTYLTDPDDPACTTMEIMCIRCGKQMTIHRQVW